MEENVLLKENLQKAESARVDNEKVIENLRNDVQNDAIEVAALRSRLKALEDETRKKDESMAKLEQIF